jgi:hypothetical protein
LSFKKVSNGSEIVCESKHLGKIVWDMHFTDDGAKFLAEKMAVHFVGFG